MTNGFQYPPPRFPTFVLMCFLAAIELIVVNYIHVYMSGHFKLINTI
jgi:hypothetical protein